MIKKFLVCLLWVSQFSLMVKAETPSYVSIIDVLHKLQNVHPNLSIGYETIYGANELQNKIPISPELLQTILGGKLEDTARLINDKTNFSCYLGKDYIVVVPKNSTKYSAPVSELKFVIPSASKLSISDFLGQIRVADDQDQRLLLRLSAFSGSQISGGLISTQPGTYTGYEILNELARQLNAKVWTVNDMPEQDKNGVPTTPLHTLVARVSFYLKR